VTNGVRKALGLLATASLIASVAATAVAGSAAAASSIPVVPGSISIGTINNTVDGTAQAIPSVIIGANDQATGTVVIREAAAGKLGASYLTNVLRVCFVSQTGAPEIFTRAPWLVVTNGDLTIRANSDPTFPSGAAAPGTGVRGYLGVGGTNCAQWIVFAKSATASTLEIRGSGTDGAMLASGPNNGPHVNVNAQQVPGPVTLSLLQIPYDQFSNGSIPASLTDFDIVQNAVRVYGANVAVAAVSQPEIRRGLIGQAAGDVTITETATYQLGAPTFLGYRQQAIWFQIVANNQRDVLPSVYFATDRTAPVVSTNSAASGLVARFDRWWNNTTFSVITEQRAFVPVAGAWVPGVITVSKLAYSATNDAALGPVQLQVCSTGGLTVSNPSDFAVCPGRQTGLLGAVAENPANFNQTVSNAKVVEDSSILGAIAPGVAGPGTNKWTFNTVIVKKGTYVTLRLQAVKGAVVGDRIEIWGRTSKTGAWTKLTTRLVGANGYIFYFKKVSGYQEFYAVFNGSNTAAMSYAVPRYYRALGK
jgi:hypothetical protein